MLTLFKELNKNQVAVWVYENKLKLAFTGETPPDQLIDKVKQKRDSILDFLNEKSIFSEEDFRRFISNENHAGVDAPATSSNNKIEAIFPATSLQQGFVYHYLAQPQDDAYRVQLLLDYHTNIDMAAYKQAWTLASLRFPILRTAFNWEGKILQIVTAGASISAENFRHEDITPLSEEEKNRTIDNIQQHDRTLPFDLRQPGLARFTLIKQHQQLVTVLITLHHSIIDGWSTPVLLQTVHDYYNALTQGHTPDIVVDNAYLATQQYYQDHQAETDLYWSERKMQWQGANDLLALLSHRIDLTKIKAVEKPAEQQLTVQGNAYEQLKSTCRTHGITLNVALQFAWHKLLHIYTGDAQTMVGTTVSGRDIPVAGIESSVGLYINTLPLAVEWKPTDSVVTVLHNIQKTIADLNSHSAVSLAGLQSDGERLFQSLLVFENYPAAMEAENQSSIEQTLTFRRAVEKVDYPLSLIAYEQGNRLVIKFNYGKNWLEDEQAQRLLGQLERILHALACHPEQPHTAITCLSEAERYTLLHSWNQTDASYPQDKTLPQLFEAQAAQCPDATAIVFEDQNISYGELNRRANQLAHHLIALGVRPDGRIGICLERSVEMVVGILAILKAGGAYLPLDPAYPTERLAYMLEDAAPMALLTHTALADKLTTSVPTVWLDNPALGLDTQPDTNPDTQARGLTAHHLAYVIYTSGSTGQPKGVMVEHRNVLNLIINNSFADIGPDDCVAHCANSAFDAATWEIWSGLIHGARILLIPEKTLLHPEQFSQCLLSERVSALFLTTALFNQYAELIAPALSGLRYVLFGGELSDSRPAIRLRATHAPSHLLHVYGPTETTTFTTAYDIPMIESEEEKLPIGRPISNTQIYILDKHGQPVPQGAAGEIYIGGDGVARGYLNQPGLTAERFLNNPFSSEPGARMYKTGDLGRYLPDGNIDYLGRNDLQVKIRGFRIELGEIESALAAHPLVKQAVVIAHDQQGHKVLAAYLVAEDAVPDDMLLAHLSDRLPDYMLPTSFTFMGAIPLTLNGKVDRRALPDPLQRITDHYVAPQNALETQLCTLWQDVLGVNQVGVHDNFFRIGGDSIVSIQLASKLRQAGFSLQVKTIFEAPTVAQLAQLLMQTTTANKSEIVAEQGLLNGEFALLPVQQTFFDWPLAQPNHWNQAFMVQIPGNIPSGQIGRALIALTERHDILRVRFVATEQGYHQYYSADIPSSQPRLKHRDIRQCNQEELHQQLTQWQSEFDYHNGPLWQAAHLTGYADSSARLFFAFHHLIIDVVSWRIIAEDLRLLLQGAVLPAKTSSYRQWVAAVHQYAQQHQHEVSYWQQVLADHHSPSALENFTHHQLGISAEMTDILLHEANGGYHMEINDLLLSALSMALQVTFEQSVNHILLEGHGRELIDNTIDVSETVGWFTTLYPVRLENQSDIADTLIHTKEMLRAVPNKGIGYGALQQAGYLTGDLPAISFNYLGQLGSVLRQDWSITDDDCGTMIASDNNSHFLLGINGSVQAGKLRFYVDSRLPQSKTALFIRAFEQALHDVIMTAQKQARTGGIKTASDYGIKGLSVKHLRHLQQRYQLEALSPASSLQQGFIYHHLAQPQDDAYRVQLLLDYHTNIDTAAYQQAWTLASLRFPILRTAFDWTENVLQIATIGASIGAANFRHEDITQLAEEERDREIDILQQSDRRLPFDLSQPGLARFTLIKQHQQLVTVLITLHHSIIDGWSYPILLQTVHDYYNALAQGRTPEIVVDNAYLAAQQYYQDHQAETDIYWSERKTQWQGANDLSALLSHRVDLSPVKTVEKPAERQLTVEGNAYERLKNTCRTQGVTLNVALQFAWHKLLHIYTGDAQTMVGTTVSGRDIPVAGIESSVGLYINTLPLAVQWKPTDSVVNVLQNIQKDIADLNSHSAVSLAGLQSDGERLFQSLLVFENYPAPVAGEHQTGIEQSLTFRRAVEKVDYPLSLIAYEQGNQLIIRFNYGKDWLEEEQVQRLLGQLERILNAVACHPEQLHTAITCLSEAERHTLLHSWNQTDASYPQDKTLQELFEAQAAQRSDATAIVFENQSISYGELNRRANRLAYHLIALGVRPDDRVAICLERSAEMVVGILAILKAGGAYLPLDPTYPAERLAYMLEDAAPMALLTHTAQADKLTTSVPMVWLDNPAVSFDTLPDANPNIQALGLTARHLAYVIYTSGSTGQPKGVMVEHRNVLRLIINNNFADIGPDDCVAHCANPAFDAATWEIWSALLNGSCLHIVPQEVVLEPIGFREALRKGNVTALWLTAGLFNEYLDTLQPVFGQLRYLLVGGDILNPQKIKQVLSADHPPVYLLNGYGPTESTTFATTYAITVPVDVTQPIPIGRPIANTRIYLLDTHQQPVPMGVVGEIYISGDGLARGYLNQPELTTACFLADPFSSESGERMYKTGDLGRWLPDGNIDYLGRNDFQIKIRGYRIELGEIESALAGHPQVKQAVVIVREHQGHKVLAAYLVAEDGVSDDVLLTHLSVHLPDYMLPASFTFIDAIPLMLNGKVDRRSLPEPVFGDRENYVAPRNALETRLCAIWQAVLGLERVSINDNFFRIGGNSLLAIKLTSEIFNQIAIDIPLNIFFSCKCIASLSQWLAMDNKKISLLNFLTPESMATDKLFMIHPANGGSESYAPLANMLANNYNCIGIDNYNLSTNNQIESLQRLAHIYMELILTEISIDRPIRILGWSLGGQLAMEVAYQLEQIGAQKIQLFLLDTVINNAEIKIIKKNINISNVNLLIIDELQKMGASDTYINKVLEIVPLGYTISNCDLSGILRYTNVILFKAGKISLDYNDSSQIELAELSVKVADNNISQWMKKPLEIKLLDNHHHNNILECTSVIHREIINSSEIKEAVLI
ncbi:amino acid adenylation domain-containing protein [Xenorhabdus stockiae]|uniref:amino acid adenylation domain-containing protein n=1 Tax=Xenorhabdus stockiae TaxID=351614 RepID=UPI003CEAA127